MKLNMDNYLCANRHHFRADSPRCPVSGCTAEVRHTAVNPLEGPAPAFEKLPRGDWPAATAPPPTKHSIRWWAYVDGERVRRTSSMADRDYTWDATCACGWDSGTGGEPMADVDRLAQAHKRS